MGAQLIAGRLDEREVAQLKRRLNVKTNQDLIKELARYYIQTETNKAMAKLIKKKKVGRK